MNLQLFRDHLAAELSNLPDIRSHWEVQSYALTTATLARRILKQLNINDLTIPSELHSERPAYSLSVILDCIIHYRVLHQDALSLPFPGSKDDVITLYSDRNLRYRNRFYIRLAVYFELMGRLAHDDPFVAHYLLRRAVTLLSMTVNTNKKFGAHFLKDLSYLVTDAWDLLIKLAETKKIEIPSDVDVNCYEDVYGNPINPANRYSKLSSCPEFVDGCGSTWWWAPFTPSKVKVGCADIYCIFLDEIKLKENGPGRGLVVPLSTFIDLFKAAQKQLA